MARLGLAALGVLVALGLAEGRAARGRRPRPPGPVPRHRACVPPGRDPRYARGFPRHPGGLITPHRVWHNHFSNAFGFHDEEFVEPKPPGRLRILAVGDSFTFAPVPYPQGVMTLTEAGLRTACRGRDLDVLNMGLMGAGAPEYRVLVELGIARFAPDLVLVNSSWATTRRTSTGTSTTGRPPSEPCAARTRGRS